MKNKSFEILIPSYNGRSLLAKHLPEAISFSGKDTLITVVDDGSRDDTGEFLKEKFPKVRCLHHPKNLGFAKSVNLGFKEAKSDLVVLLNNDVSPTKDYLSPVFKHFENELTFAVTLNETTSSWPQVSFRGKLQYERGGDKEKARYSAWASGGSAVFSRSIWERLGGFDEVYSPGYWEDIDIGWRAWKAGYFIVWEPGAKVEHQHESTFGVLNKKFVSHLKERNELIVNWKNITNGDLRQEHFNYLFKHTLTHPGYIRVILEALATFPKAKKTKDFVRSDRGVLDLVNQVVP